MDLQWIDFPTLKWESVENLRTQDARGEESLMCEARCGVVSTLLLCNPDKELLRCCSNPTTARATEEELGMNAGLGGVSLPPGNPSSSPLLATAPTS